MRGRQAGPLLALGLVTWMAATGCLSDTTHGEPCVSDYEVLASAPTWNGLESELLDSGARGRVASVRVVERGVDVGTGDQKAVRVVDLLDRRDRRLAQAEVWRDDAGGWRAGLWMQCID